MMFFNMQYGILLALLASLTSAWTLIEVLKENGAEQFALALEADPDLLFFLSSEVRTVFAPIDGYISNNTGAPFRRSAASNKRQQVSKKLTTLSEDQGTTSSTTSEPVARMVRRSLVDGGGWIGTAVETLETATKLAGDNVSVVVEVGLLLAPYAKRDNIGPVHSNGVWSSYSATTSTIPSLPASAPAQIASEALTVTSTFPEAGAGSGTIGEIPAAITSTVAASSGFVPPRSIKVASGLGYRVNVLRADIPYNNGLIHITDGYFEHPDPVSTTLSAQNLTGFSGLLAQTNLSSAIDSLSNVTIFAPSNTAVAASNLSSTSSGQLLGVANAHIIPNFVGYFPELKDGATYETIGGGSITITIRGGHWFINGARILNPDIITDNGVIHVVDQVLEAGPVLFTSDLGILMKHGWSLLAVMGGIIVALAFK